MNHTPRFSHFSFAEIMVLTNRKASASAAAVFDAGLTAIVNDTSEAIRPSTLNKTVRGPLMPPLPLVLLLLSPPITVPVDRALPTPPLHRLSLGLFDLSIPQLKALVDSALQRFDAEKLGGASHTGVARTELEVSLTQRVE
jgi:hypothetical protein